MKKIFVYLLTIWIPVYVLIGLLASCEKSTVDENTLTNQAPPSNNAVKTGVVGKWQLLEFFQDMGNGQGNWIPAQETEQVTFTSAGDFVFNGKFPLSLKQFDKYKIIDGSHVQLYASQSDEQAIYLFKRESDQNLLFNAVCKENCSRRYSIMK